MPAVRLSGAPSARDAPGLTPPLPTRSPTQCSVCLMDVENDATSMPCGHLHHKECLTRWLRTHNTCPLCRSTIEADETARPNNALQTLLQGWREARREHTAAAGISGVSASTSTVDAGANPSVVNSSTNGSNGSGRANMGSISFGEAPFFFHGQAPALMPALPPPSEAELLGFSVAELKARLRQLGVDPSTMTPSSTSAPSTTKVSDSDAVNAALGIGSTGFALGIVSVGVLIYLWSKGKFS